MKILLTGVAGFLGSHIARDLLDSGHTVVGIDDMSTGREENLATLIREKRFEFFLHDVRDPLNLNVDGIMNFACPASPIHYQSDPVKTIETNFLGMINLLRLAKNLNIRILQASTSEIYGDPSVSPQPEDYWGNVNPIGIRSCYDEGKRAAETLCFDYMRQFNVDVRVVRIFNTYGPNMAVGDGRVVSNFVVQALSNLPLSVFGDGSQSRSFCYVDDLVDGIMRTMFHPKKLFSPINLGNPTEFTMMELAQKILTLTNSKSETRYSDLPGDDPRQRKPDITRAKSVLGWEPTWTLDSGLNRTVDYFRQELKK